jgi:hypothetical protein
VDPEQAHAMLFSSIKRSYFAEVTKIRLCDM